MRNLGVFKPITPVALVACMAIVGCKSDGPGWVQLDFGTLHLKAKVPTTVKERSRTSIASSPAMQGIELASNDYRVTISTFLPKPQWVVDGKPTDVADGYIIETANHIFVERTINHVPVQCESRFAAAAELATVKAICLSIAQR
jgi:hypothetical protein